MAGLLDFSSTVDVNNPPSTVMAPWQLGLLNAAAGAAPYLGYSRLPVSGSQIIAGMAGGYGKGYLEGLQGIAQAQQNQLAGLNLSGFQNYQRWLNGGYPNASPGADASFNHSPKSAGQAVAQSLMSDDASGVITGPSQAGVGASSPPRSLMSLSAPPAPSTATAAPALPPVSRGAIASNAMSPAIPVAQGQANPSAGASPLFDLRQLMGQYRMLSAIPAAQQQASQVLSLIEKGLPEGAQLMSDGSIQARPGYNTFVTDKAMGEKGFTPLGNGSYAPAPGGPADLGYIGNAEAAKQWGGYAPKLALEQNKPYALRGPGSSLIMGNRVIAQNPYAVNGVDASGHPFTTFVQPPIYTPGGLMAGGPPTGGGAPNGVPSSGGGLLNPRGLTSENARNIDQFMRSQGFGGPAPAPPTAAPSGSSPNITYSPTGVPIVQTGLSPLEKSSAEARSKELETYAGELDKNAQAAVNNSFLIDQMRHESLTWQQGKFADFKNDALAYAQSFAKSFGIDTPGLDKQVGDYQSFFKNSFELVRQAVRQTSSRAAVQEFRMIQSALPNPEMTAKGFNQIADQFQSTYDYQIATQRAAQQWRASHSGTLDGFEAAWNQAITPAAFLAHRMSGTDLATLAANLQKTPEGRAELTKLQAQIQTAQRLNLFDEAQ